MLADTLWRGLATGATALAIVGLFRQRGLRAAGLLAALPMLSAPALFRLSVEHSPAFATAAAVASLHATGLTASLLLLYALASRRIGALSAALLSGAGALLLAWLTRGVGSAFVPTLLLTLGLVVMAQRILPRLAPGASARRFLRGYLDGLLVRCTFLAVLAPTLLPLGGWLAFTLALLAAVATLVTVTSLRREPHPDQGGGQAGGCATTREGSDGAVAGCATTREGSEGAVGGCATTREGPDGAVGGCATTRAERW